MKDTPVLVWGVIGTALAAAIGFSVFAAMRMSAPVLATFWNNTEIACIPGHTNLALHIHPELSIIVDGAPEMIPANIGISSDCMAEIHTHEADGVIHVESIAEGRTFTLGDFFTVWGTSIERPGFTLTATVNGSSTPDVSTVTLKDKDKISLAYTKQN